MTDHLIFTRLVARLLLVAAACTGLLNGLMPLLGAAAASPMIAYVNHRDEIDIALYDLSRDRNFIYPLPGSIETDPTWSPDGQQIAFLSNRYDGVNRVYVMDTNGANTRLLTPPANDPDQRVLDYQRPLWSTDGRWVIAMRRYPVPRSREVVAADINSGTMMTLSIDHPEAQRYLSLFQPDRYPAPDSNQSVYLDLVAGEWRLVLVTGEADTRLLPYIPTFQNITQFVPPVVWSPDGAYLL
ncbi:MAG: TolB family protein, partial [Chloroflexota bacterium]